jgi:hypothetical protein
MAFKHTEKTHKLMAEFDKLYAGCVKAQGAEFIAALVSGKPVAVPIDKLQAALGCTRMQVLGAVAWLEQGEVLYQIRNSKRAVVALAPFASASALSALDNL